MTQIVGTIVDSGGVPITGTLTVTLDAPLVDVSTTPDQIYLNASHSFAIASGNINFTITQSATQNVTYHFVVDRLDSRVDYYLSDGTQYTGPVVVNPLDTFTYTGTYYDATNSQRVGIVTSSIPATVLDFHAIVPNVAQCDFSNLLPSRISTDNLPTTVRQLALLLTSDPDFNLALRGGPRFKGAYSSATYYQKDDLVTYGGSSWLFVNATPTPGQTPSTLNTTYWQILAQKGDSGGTGGNDTAYDAAGWDGATDAPSRNAVRDLVEGFLVKNSTLASYAPIANPTFTGAPSGPSPTTGDRTTRLATTNWVGNEFATVNNAALTGTPTVPTAATASNSQVIANTAWVNSIKAIANGLATLDSSSKIPVAQLGFTQTSAASGYIKFPNGIIVQWTDYSVASQSFTGGNFYTFAIAFPISFSQVYQAIGCQASGNSASSYINLTFETLTASQVTATIVYGATTTIAPRFRVFAIGI